MNRIEELQNELYKKISFDYEKAKLEHDKFMSDCQKQKEEIQSWNKLKQPKMTFLRKKL